ncbi:MAG: hypothetical protein AAFW69_12225 [Pseudomonadota bacterium]
MAAILTLDRPRRTPEEAGEETGLDFYVIALAMRDPGCREVVEDAVFLIAEEVARLPALLGARENGRLAAAAERIADLAWEVGFTALARVAQDLRRLAEAATPGAALAAVSARLKRLADALAAHHASEAPHSPGH